MTGVVCSTSWPRDRHTSSGLQGGSLRLRHRSLPPSLTRAEISVFFKSFLGKFRLIDFPKEAKFSFFYLFESKSWIKEPFHFTVRSYFIHMEACLFVERREERESGDLSKGGGAPISAMMEVILFLKQFSRNCQAILKHVSSNCQAFVKHLSSIVQAFVMHVQAFVKHLSRLFQACFKHFSKS